MSMMERIRSQLMSIFCTKQAEVVDKWQGPIYPKIMKRIQKMQK